MTCSQVREPSGHMGTGTHLLTSTRKKLKKKKNTGSLLYLSTRQIPTSTCIWRKELVIRGWWRHRTDYFGLFCSHGYLSVLLSATQSILLLMKSTKSAAKSGGKGFHSYCERVCIGKCPKNHPRNSSLALTATAGTLASRQP